MRLFPSLFKKPESAADRRAWLDDAISAAGSRVMAQQTVAARRASRSFEAAETPAWVESWPTHSGAINDDLAAQLPTMRSRSRGLARNNEWAINYLIKLDDNVLGTKGIQLQMRLTKRNGDPDENTNALIETAWSRLSKAVDVAGRSFRSVESLALAALATDGEICYQFRKGAGPLGFQIRLFPADLIDVNYRSEWRGNRIRMGIEINDDGLPVAYWMLAAKTGDLPSDIVTVGRHTRVPADQMRHLFLQREIDQLRGYPWLAAGAQRLWMTHDFEVAAAVASSNAAKRQGFFYTPDGEAPTGFADTIVSSVLDAAKAQGKVLSPDEIKAIVSAAEKYVTTMPGQFDTLPNGTQFQAFDSKWPDVAADTYVKQQLRGWFAARGISYVSGGNDLEGVNYSSAQVGIVAERDHYRTLQARLTEWLHAPIFEAALPYLILSTPGLRAEHFERYLAAATWQPRSWQPVDPVKAANANETNLRAKLTSRRRIMIERGDDPDELFAEIDAEDAKYGDIPPASAQAQNDTTATDAADAAANKPKGKA